MLHHSSTQQVSYRYHVYNVYGMGRVSGETKQYISSCFWVKYVSRNSDSIWPIATPSTHLLYSALRVNENGCNDENKLSKWNTPVTTTLLLLSSIKLCMCGEFTRHHVYSSSGESLGILSTVVAICWRSVWSDLFMRHLAASGNYMYNTLARKSEHCLTDP